MTEIIKNFQDLRIWQKGIEVIKDIYILTKKFPKEELCGLTSLMRRAAVSVPSYIVEGCARDSQADYICFLYIAFGSLRELRYQLSLSKRLGFFAYTGRI